MKAKCITNRSGYEYDLVVGKEYEILDIQDSIFAGDYYVIAKLDENSTNKTASTHLYRFDITKEQAEAYVIENHSDWRSDNG